MKFTSRNGKISIVAEIVKKDYIHDNMEQIRISVIDNGLGIKKKD